MSIKIVLLPPANIHAKGAKKGDFRAIAVSTDISPPASPCGMCRQFIREFCEVRHSMKLIEVPPSTDSLPKLQMPILMYDRDGKATVMTLEQLLPMSFGPDKLLSTEELTIALAT